MSAPRPGPWKVTWNEDEGHMVDTAEGRDVAMLCRHDMATARLIAAAPEMLEALKWVLPLAEAYLKDAPGHVDNAKLESARAAIAKAEGRTE